MCKWLMTVILVVNCVLANSLSAQDGPKPVHTNRSRFRIPYRFDAKEMERLKAQEIRLYTSINQGQRWQLVQTVPPNSSRFEFQATADGEYWFAVRTLDGNNQLHPAGKSFSPGLKVVVDKTDPVLKLELRQSKSGMVELNWSAIDRNLNLDKLVLEFTQAGDTEWQPIRVDPKDRGQASWSVPEGGIVAVRGKIEDMAGNAGSMQTQISVDPANTSKPVRDQPDFRRPVASPESPVQPPQVPDRKPQVAARSPESTQSPLMSREPTRTNTPVEQPGVARAFPDESLLEQVLKSPLRPKQSVRPQVSPGKGEPETEAFQASRHPFAPRETGVAPATPRMTPQPPQVAKNPFATPQPETPIVQPVVKPVAEPIVERTAQPRQEIPVADQKETRPEALQGRYEVETPNQDFEPKGSVRIVNKTKFEIDYQLSDVGSSEVQSVELFITNDNGKRWWRYGPDEDNKRPFDVEVPVEGIYGFAMRVHTGKLSSGEDPRNGDDPEMSVIVDQTAPEAKLLSYEPNADSRGTQVAIRWKVADRYPSGAPVSLSYSVSKDGPWVPMTGWQADQGHFDWRVGPQVPPNVYLKLEARDAAGNMSTDISKKPLDLSLTGSADRVVDSNVNATSGSRR